MGDKSPKNKDKKKKQETQKQQRTNVHPFGRRDQAPAPEAVAPDTAKKAS